MAGSKDNEKHYVPRYNEKTDQSGTRIKPKQHAEEAAKYLAQTQWGDWPTENQGNHFEPIHTQGIKFNKYPPKYNGGLITSTEVDEAIFRTKRHKAPGPDGIPAEFFKLLDFKSRLFILELFNSWFSGEQKVPCEAQLAKVILIHKKGNPALFENYRPISLLNNLLKIYARILKARLEAGMEQELNNTQYGFRASCSTSYPIHIIRRALEKAEREGSELHCLALDWKMAFDRLKQGQIRKALEKHSVPEDLIVAIESLYGSPAFWTEIDKVRSSTHPQKRGIRQGCTLSRLLCW